MLGKLITLATAAVAAKKAYDSYKEKQMVEEMAADITPQAEGSGDKPARKSAAKRSGRSRKDAPSA